MERENASVGSVSVKRAASTSTAGPGVKSVLPVPVPVKCWRTARSVAHLEPAIWWSLLAWHCWIIPRITAINLANITASQWSKIFTVPNYFNPIDQREIIMPIWAISFAKYIRNYFFIIMINKVQYSWFKKHQSPQNIYISSIKLKLNVVLLRQGPRIHQLHLCC